MRGQFSGLPMVTRPDLEMFRSRVCGRADRTGPRVGTVTAISKMAKPSFIRGRIKGRSKILLDALARLERVAPTPLAVLIRGETGTGKELAARLVHDRSGRAHCPFKPVNCAAIPETFLESMLFGHTRGAFTGALRSQRGIFVAAHGGTVFLDEIGDMSLPLQTKILRVLEEGTVQPLGTDEVKRVDVRIVAATHRDLQKMMMDGNFRQDLYHRLKAYAVGLPALRDRGHDIVMLARYFLRRFCPSKRLSLATERLLLSQEWPGNIRELRNVIEAASVDAGRTVQPKHVFCHLDSENEVMGENGNGSRIDQILSVVDRLGSASPVEIRDETSLQRTTLSRALAAIVAAGVLKRLGEGRRTRYARASSEEAAQLTARQTLILRHVEDSGRVTRLDCAEMTGSSIRTASRDISQLVELGRLVPDGQTGKAGGYVLP